MISPKHFLFGLSGLGVTSGGLLAWLIVKGDGHKVLSLVFKTKDEAGQALTQEGEKECGKGTVWMNNNKGTSLTQEFYKRKNELGKDWNEYQSCLDSISKKEKYKLLSTGK